MQWYGVIVRVIQQCCNLSSFFLQAIVSDIPDRPQENTPTHTLQQPNVTTQLQRQVSSMLPPPSQPEGNAPVPASAQQRDITMPTPQHPEQDVLISAQQRGNSVSTTPSQHVENVSNPVAQRKNAVPRRLTDMCTWLWYCYLHWNAWRYYGGQPTTIFDFSCRYTIRIRQVIHRAREFVCTTSNDVYNSHAFKCTVLQRRW